MDNWRRGTRGPLPQLSILQLLNALVLIEREGPLGRRTLAKWLQINDGVARGLLERLAEQKIITVKKETGVQLTEDGKKNLHKFLRQLSIRKILPLEGSELIKGKSAVAVHLTRSYRSGMTGIGQRDEAIKAGADGAITVAVSNGRLVVPPDNKILSDFAPRESTRIQEDFKPSDGDLIIIGFGKDEHVSLAGALAAVLSLQR